MNTFAKSTLLTALLVPAAAFAGLELGTPVGTSENDVRAALTAMGYEVLEIEIEGTEIEAEVRLDGALFEIEVAADTGLVTEIEAEDDDSDIDS